MTGQAAGEPPVVCVLAHASDIHLGQDRQDGGARAAERTRRVLRHLHALSGEVDAVLLTGDLTDHGTPQEYARLADLLSEFDRQPLHCPGNHDVRGPYRAGLLGGSPDDAAAVNQVHRLERATVMLCDSSVPGQDHGRLDRDTLEWLDGVLTETERDTPPAHPVLVCFHHPPVPLHAPHVDGIRQFGTEGLAAVLARHPRVVAVLCGHAHTPAATIFAGLSLGVAPGVVSTVRLPWEGGPLLDHAPPPMVAFHVVDGSGRVTTHVRTVP